MTRKCLFHAGCERAHPIRTKDADVFTDKGQHSLDSDETDNRLFEFGRRMQILSHRKQIRPQDLHRHPTKALACCLLLH